MQAGMAAYPPAVGGVPGSMPGYPPGVMPPYQLQGSAPMVPAVPRGPLFPSVAASVGSNSQPRQVRVERVWMVEGASQTV